jgi:hypothetical protein
MKAINEFESVCQKEFVLYLNWSGEQDEEHRQRQNRVAAYFVRTLSNTSPSSLEPTSWTIQFHHTELVS